MRGCCRGKVCSGTGAYARRFISLVIVSVATIPQVSFLLMATLTESATTALQLVAACDPTLLSIVWRSLAVSATACVLACSLGIVLGAWLGVARFTGRGTVLTVLNTLLAVPSVVVGLVVYLLLSRSGPLGFLGWLFSFKAMVLAQAHAGAARGDSAHPPSVWKTRENPPRRTNRSPSVPGR